MTQKRGAAARLTGAATALLTLALFCVLTPAAKAWCTITDEAMSKLTPEQKTLVSSVPDAHRAVTYCLLTGTDAEEFFTDMTDYDTDTIKLYLDYVGGDSSAALYYYDDFYMRRLDTAENRRTTELFYELYLCLAGKLSSYTDVSYVAKRQDYYTGELHKLTREELETYATALEKEEREIESGRAGSAYQLQQLRAWLQATKAWLVYRGGKADALLDAEKQRELEQAGTSYDKGAYPSLDADRQAVLNAVSEVFRPLTYARLTGTDGLSWFRENSSSERDAVLQYWCMDTSALGKAGVACLERGAGLEDPELVLIRQIMLLKNNGYSYFAYNTTGRGNQYFYQKEVLVYWHDAHLLPDAEASQADIEQLRRVAEQDEAAARSQTGELKDAASAWAAYLRKRVDRMSAAAEYAETQRAEELESRRAQAQERTGGRSYEPTSIPTDLELSDWTNSLLRRIPRRFLASAVMLATGNRVSAEDFFERYTAEPYREDARKYLAMELGALEAEYIRLVALKNAGALSDQNGNRLELVSEMMQARYRQRGWGFLPTYVQINEDGTAAVVHDRYYESLDTFFSTVQVKLDRLTREAERLKTAQYADTAPYQDYIALCLAYDDTSESYRSYYENAREAEQSGSRTYLLEACTGLGDGKRVDFFRIVYESPEDGGSTECTQYLFPAENSLRDGYLSARASGDPDKKRADFLEQLGYALPDVESLSALGSFRTDQFLFTADREIGTVKELQVFMRGEGEGSSTWTCSCLRLYRVDTVAGLRCGGFYSAEPYIDFSGAMIAQVLFGDENGEDASSARHEITPEGGDTLFRFGGALSTPGYALWTGGANERPHSIVGDRENMILRLDFADQYKAGLECLATAWNGGKTLASGGLCEALALRLRYRDTWGAVRETCLPMIASTAAWAVLNGGIDGDREFGGLAQQGETLAFSCYLPDYQSMIRLTPILGSSFACEAAGLTGSAGGANTSGRAAAAALSETDEAAITAVAVYDPARGALGVRMEDGFLRYSFPSLPTSAYRVKDVTGTRLYPGAAGTEIELTAVDGDSAFSSLRPRADQERYLVTLTTDDVELGGTTADITLRLAYEDLEGYERDTGTIRVRDLVNDFYGYWPASREEYAYLYGLSADTSAGAAVGRSLRFLVPVRDVQRFRGVTLSLGGSVQDEWQMKNVTIQTAESVGMRSLQWTPNRSADDAMSDRVLDREVTGRTLYDYAKGGALGVTNAAQGGDTPDAETAVRTSRTGPLLFQRGDVIQMDLETSDVAEKAEPDWRDLRYNMTYSDAVGNLDFLKARNNYTVEVKVGSNLANAGGDDDCGSKNQFYFQLLFSEGGASGMVLANQQLESDGFRSGVTETFTIATNQDYGDVTAVRVIAEDIASDSDKYDKLKIESITVKRESGGELSPLWRINDVGWVGIDYRDEGQTNTVDAAAGRTMAEISHVYPVTESSYAVNVQISISTSAYVDRSKEHNGEATEQYQGELEAWIYYRDVQGRVQSYHIGDVVELMYAFNNRTADHAVSERSGEIVTGRAVSDPRYMFRPNHTDRFEVSLDGLEKLLYINFFARSSVESTWNVSDVSAYLVRGQGRRVLNVAGEYVMSYPAGQEPELIGSGSSQTNPKYYCQLLPGISSGTPSVSASFSSAEVKVNDAVMQTQSVIQRYPAAEIDALNLVLYQSAPDGRYGVYDMTATARYSVGDIIMDTSARMNRAVENGAAVYYAEGLSASGVKALNAVSARAETSGAASVSGGFVQRVRGDCVLDTWDLGAMSNLEVGMQIPFETADSERQLVTLQLTPETTAMKLTPEKTDVAVSISYKAEGPIDREFQSPRVFLTDQGIHSVAPGQIVELSFAQGHVKEITGVTVYTVGPVSAGVSEGYAVALNAAGDGGAPKGRYSFAPADAVTAGVMTKLTARADDSVQPITLRFTTGVGTNNSGSGTSGAVSVRIGYYDDYGAERVRYIDDIRPYLTGGNGTFNANSVREACILVNDVRELRWIELAPKTESGGAMTVWNLQRLSVRLGDGGHEAERLVTEPLIGGGSYRFYLANIQVSATVEYPVLGLDAENAQTVRREELKNGVMSVLLGSGATIRVTPSVIGSREGVSVSLYSLDPVTGAIGGADLRDTRGFTEETIRERERIAASPEEVSVWRSVTPDVGTWSMDGDAYVFTPPRNYTGGSLNYRIVVSSVEYGSASVTIDVAVSNENDPVAQRIADLRAWAERQPWLDRQEDTDE